MLNRQYGASYRFGFNGKEQDNEVEGKGDILDFGARIYDPRIGRFYSVDPEFRRYAALGSYDYVANSPLMLIDKSGRTITNTEKPGTKEYLLMSTALNILKHLDAEKYKAMEESKTNYNVGFGSLPSSQDGGTRTNFTNSNENTSLSVMPQKDSHGQLTGGTIYRTLDGQEQDDIRKSSGKEIESGKTPVTEQFAKDILSVTSVDITINKSLAEKLNAFGQDENKMERVKAVAHELFGHAYYNTMTDIVQGFVWNQISEEKENGERGHDTNNPSGQAATKAEEKVTPSSVTKAENAIKKEEKAEQSKTKPK